MYLALFLTPWILMYALSTMAMNHRDFFAQLRGGSGTSYAVESEGAYPGAYPGTFPPGDKPREMAQGILRHLGLDGTHYVQQARETGRLTIYRESPLVTRRITYTPADRRVVVERAVFHTPSFLEELHRRRGFEHDYPLEDAWGFIVDIVIVSIVFWDLSGVWMWLQLAGTRRLGLVFAVCGLALFVLFLSAI